MAEGTDESAVVHQPQDVRTVSAPESAAPTSGHSPLLIFIAYRRGPDEGDECARWLNDGLNGQELRLDAGRKAQIRTYFDMRAPAIHDWTQKWKGDLRTARAMILVCSKGTGARRAGVDWLYDEIEWWVKNRRTAPIVVIANRDDPSVVPAPILSRWPKAQRVVWSANTSQGEQTAVLERIIDGLIISERGINYEELRRLKIKNRWLLALTLTALLLAVMLFFFARSERAQRRLAERNLQLAYGPTLQVALSNYAGGNIAEAKYLLLAIQPKLRGFEWNLLRSLADQSQQTWAEPEGVQDLEYSPDGSILVLGRSDGKLIVRSMKYPSQKDQELEGDFERVTERKNMAGPDGQQLGLTFTTQPSINRVVFFGPTQAATIGNDGRVRLWDFSSPSLETLKPADTQTRRTLAISPDRKWLASGAEDGIVNVWQVSPTPAQDPVATFNVGWEPAALAFSPDSTALVVAGLSMHPQTDYSPYVQLWDWKAQQKIGQLESDVQVYSLCLLGEALYGGRDDGSIVTWDLQTQKKRVVLSADPKRGTISLLTPAPSGRLLAAVTGSFLTGKKKIIVWEPSTGHVRTLTGAEEDIKALRFDHRGERLLSASGHKVAFYDLRRPEPRLDLPAETTQSLDVSSDGNTLVTSSETANTSYFRVGNLSDKTSRVVPAPPGVTKLVLFRDGSHFVAGWLDGSIQCYRVADGALVWRSKALARVNTLAISPDSSLLLSGSWGIPIDSFELWQAQTGKRTGTLTRSGLGEFSRDGKMLATGGFSHIHVKGETEPPLFRLYRLPDMQEITSGPARRELPNAMALDPQGQRLLLAGDEGEMWRLSNPPELLYHTPLQGKLPTAAAFSPDGSRFVMSLSGVLTIWNAETGDLLLRLGPGEGDFYGAVKWVGNKLYAQNRGRVTIFDGDTEGLENWEATGSENPEATK